MLEDPLPMPPRGEEKVSFGRRELDRMLDEYYELRGWDRDGRPRADTLKRLGIEARS
jgi:aldehyde:ferredoxin oxidoreductase